MFLLSLTHVMETRFSCSYFLRIFTLSTSSYHVFLHLNSPEPRCRSKTSRGGVLNSSLVIYEQLFAPLGENIDSCLTTTSLHMQPELKAFATFWLLSGYRLFGDSHFIRTVLDTRV